jgi:ribosomal protein S18 acetylase RimI-like enzyme
MAEQELMLHWEMALERDSYCATPEIPRDIRVSSLARDEDYEAIPAVYIAAFQDGNVWPPTWHEFQGFDPEGVFLAHDGDELVSFVISYVRPVAPDQGYISVVATVPSHRRRGIAAALIHQAIRRFWDLGFRKVTVDVRAGNLPAVRAYQSLGFRKMREFLADEHCENVREISEMPPGT